MRRLVKKVSFFGYDFSDFKMNVLFALVALIGGIVIAGIVLAVYDLSKKGFPIAGCALLSFFCNPEYRIVSSRNKTFERTFERITLI